VRTPRGGKANGSLAAVSPVQLLTFAQRLKERNNEFRLVEDLIVGCVTQLVIKEEMLRKLQLNALTMATLISSFFKQVLRIGSGGR
jgi:sulfur transfer protein SufE